MRTLKSLSITAAMTLAAACGTNSKQEGTSTAPEAKQETKKSSADEKALESEFAALPASVIIAVPVDAQGNEQHDKATMRLQSSSAVVSDSNVESTYAAAAAPAKLGRGELDADSSTQSWNYYQPNQGGLGYGNQGNQGYNGNGQGYGQQGNQSNSAGVNISDIQNSNVDVDITNNYNSQNGSQGYNNGNQNGGQGYFGGNGFYANYRPAAFSTAWTGNFWGYSRPHCFQRPAFRYYVYPRRCGSFNFCGRHNNNWW